MRTWGSHNGNYMAMAKIIVSKKLIMLKSIIGHRIDCEMFNAEAVKLRHVATDCWAAIL